MRRRRGRSDGESKQQEHKGKDKEMEMRGEIREAKEKRGKEVTNKQKVSGKQTFSQSRFFP